MSRGVAINSHTNHIIRANKKHAVLNPVMEKKMVKFCVTNSLSKSGTAAVKFIELLGANFKRQFNFDSYKQFFTNMGYSDVTYEVVDGRMPCALAVIKNLNLKSIAENSLYFFSLNKTNPVL